MENKNIDKNIGLSESYGRSSYDPSPEAIRNMSPEDIKQLIDDLNMHQHELEMQNEELKAAQLEIEDSRNRYYELFDFAPVSYFTLDRDGKINELNLAASKMLGVERRYLINKSFYSFLSEECEKYFRSYLENIFQSNLKQVAEIKLLNKEGKTVYAQLESVAVSNGFDESLHCRTAIIDVTKRKLIEEALKESQRFIESISAATPSLIYLYDMENDKNIYTNRAFGSILGYEIDSVEDLGKNLFSTIHHPDDLSKLSERIKYLKSIADQEVVESEYRLRNAEGDYVWFFGKEIIFKRNSDGSVKSVLGIALDITELKNIEFKLIEKNDELIRINGDLDRFVYSASHDLRAPLVSLKGLINVAKMETADKNTLSYLDLMLKSINKLDSFVQDLISFSRNSRLDVENQIIDFEELIKEIFDGLKFYEGSEKVEKILNIQMNQDFYSDRTRLNIILSNLISNALRYHNYSRDEPFISIQVKQENDTVCIEVKDNGQGIGEEHLGKIFDVFYRASNTKNGSGLGLYIVKEAILKLEGSISVKSTLNQGSCFTVEIPVKTPESISSLFPV